MLAQRYSPYGREAGCDEAGRGCLAGPVFAAAVVFPADYRNSRLDDSKKLSEKVRYSLREEIMRDAVSYGVAKVDAEEIDRINILQASIRAMHLALAQLDPQPEYVIVDGNRFRPYRNISYACIIKGDARFLSIAAASILAKTCRDDYMKAIDREYPQYGWAGNKGYPTSAHYRALTESGPSPYHRCSFRLYKEATLFDMAGFLSGDRRHAEGFLDASSRFYK